MHLLRGVVAPLLSVALVVTLVPLGSVASAAPTTSTSAASAATVSTVAAAKPKKKRYQVRPGVTFNSPVGSRATKNKINAKILTAINRARKGSTVRIMTWNFMSAPALNALLRAQKRGVTIRLLMDASNVDEDTPNPTFKRLRYELAKNNGKKRAERRSIAKTCKGSCRGKRGSAHAKYFLFEKVGGSRHVVMQGSANLTVAAAYNQWNDLFTFVGQKDVYRFTKNVFDQMWRDKPVKQPYVSFNRGRFGLWFSPYAGKGFKRDPVQSALNQVRCRGAVGGAGNKRGRTIVRSAPDVIRGNRGMVAAKQLKTLWNRGCDVRIVYTVMGVAVRKVLRSSSGRGAVPMRHLVQDFDGDGDFDNYFHIKVLTINGVLGKDRTAFLTFNGSSNTSDLATHSDENIGSLRGKGYLLRYQNHIDYWFEHPPSDGTYTGNSSTGGGAAGRMAPRVVDPYVNVDLD